MPKKKNKDNSIKEAQSKVVARDQQVFDSGTYNLIPEEQKQLSSIVKRIIRARNQREQERDEFDGMNYENVYLANKRAAMSYLTPKKNDDEVRINTGATEKRIELVLNELLSLNLEGQVKAFDKDDNLYQDVSEIFSDVVRRTEQIEMAEDKDIFIYSELLTQPSVFVEELWIEKPLNGNGKSFKIRKRCERRLLQGPQVYLGDITLPDTRWNEQPFLVKYARMPYEEGEKVLKPLNKDKWEYIKPGSYSTVFPLTEKIYRKGSIEADEVEAFWYMSYSDNEVQVVVNGVPMLELGTKYTDIFGDLGGYHITMVSLKPLRGDWAYGKPLTQSAKTLQALNNETIRNMVRKWRQALEPPIGVRGGKVFGRDIWNPGKIVQGVRKEDFERLIDHQGVTRSEMAMFDLIEKKTNEFIGTSQQEPLQGKTQVTATELIQAQQRAVKMLGLSVLACIRLRQRLTMLRVRNVLNNYTKPTSRKFNPIFKKVEDIYARFTVDGADLGGKTGTRIIQMSDRGLTPEEKKSVFAEELRSEKAGRPFRYSVVNIPALKNLEFYFYVNVVAKPKESDQLDRATFTDMINQGAAISQITGRPMNPNKLTERFERIWHERDLFEKSPPQMARELGIGPQGGEVEHSEAGKRLVDMMQGNQERQSSKASDII